MPHKPRLPILIATLALAATSFANLVTNADFSLWDSPNQPTGWTLEDTTKTRVEQSSDPLRSPLYSARETRMVDSLGNNKGLSQFVAVSPNAPYALAAWCFDEDPLVKGGVSITWRKADTTYISNSGVVNSDSGLTGWQKLTKTDSSPAEVALAEVLLRVYNLSGSTPAGGKVYFDDVEFDTGYGAIIEERPGRNAPAIALELRPNPTTGQSMVSFGLARAAHVELNVYDLTGSPVAGLYAGALNAGQHRFPFTGRNREGALLPAGLYFLVLTDGTARSTVRKVVVGP
jgi:hypothetical protein